MATADFHLSAWRRFKRGSRHRRNAVTDTGRSTSSHRNDLRFRPGFAGELRVPLQGHVQEPEKKWFFHPLFVRGLDELSVDDRPGTTGHDRRHQSLVRQDHFATAGGRQWLHFGTHLDFQVRHQTGYSNRRNRFLIHERGHPFV